MSDQSKPPTTARRILLGQIASAHGIRGEILVRTFTGDPAAIATYGPLSDKSGTRSFRLKIVRVTDKGVIARVEGVADRTAAEPLKGTELYVERSKLPPPADDEFYHADLVGLGVELEDGTAYGIVARSSILVLAIWSRSPVPGCRHRNSFRSQRPTCQPSISPQAGSQSFRR